MIGVCVCLCVCAFAGPVGPQVWGRDIRRGPCPAPAVTRSLRLHHSAEQHSAGSLRAYRGANCNACGVHIRWIRGPGSEEARLSLATCPGGPDSFRLGASWCFSCLAVVTSSGASRRVRELVSPRTQDRVLLRPSRMLVELNPTG